jgi:norsolorinic acid ketoreductase
MVPFPHAAYSPTKIAVHWSTKKMNMEEERLCAFVLNPGFVGTDSGKFGAKALGLEGIPLMTVEESCKGMIEVIRLATKTSHGGQFFNFSGEGLQW